jgi:hypothetical protein
MYEAGDGFLANDNAIKTAPVQKWRKRGVLKQVVRPLTNVRISVSAGRFMSVILLRL